MRFNILETVHIPTTDYSVVLAYIENGYCKYVTWIKNGNSYNFGHYFIDQNQAWQDFLERCIKELQIVLRATTEQ